MPYLKRETYDQWCKWVNEVCDRLDTISAGKRSYRLGARYHPIRLVLIDDLHDKVLARGMRDITSYILMIQRRYGI